MKLSMPALCQLNRHHIKHSQQVMEPFQFLQDLSSHHQEQLRDQHNKNLRTQNHFFHRRDLSIPCSPSTTMTATCPYSNPCMMDHQNLVMVSPLMPTSRSTPQLSNDKKTFKASTKMASRQIQLLDQSRMSRQFQQDLLQVPKIQMHQD